MDPQTVAIFSLALAVCGHTVAWLFKTPKESASETADRLERIETKHHALDMRFVAAEARLTAGMQHLSQTIERLIAIMERDRNGDDNHARISGRHPASDR
jgi:hypothetical protein